MALGHIVGHFKAAHLLRRLRIAAELFERARYCHEVRIRFIPHALVKRVVLFVQCVNVNKKVVGFRRAGKYLQAIIVHLAAEAVQAFSARGYHRYQSFVKRGLTVVQSFVNAVILVLVNFVDRAEDCAETIVKPALSRQRLNRTSGAFGNDKTLIVLDVKQRLQVFVDRYKFLDFFPRDSRLPLFRCRREKLAEVISAPVRDVRPGDSVFKCLAVLSRDGFIFSADASETRLGMHPPKRHAQVEALEVVQSNRTRLRALGYSQHFSISQYLLGLLRTPHKRKFFRALLSDLVQVPFARHTVRQAGRLLPGDHPLSVQSSSILHSHHRAHPRRKGRICSPVLSASAE